MAKFFDELNPKLIEFIKRQKIFFVATADEKGRINLSPKGYDALRVLSPDRIAWLNLSGSGNETAAHLRVANRMTLMFCAFAGNPLILRVYGSAQTTHPRDDNWDRLYCKFPNSPGARQIFDMRIESVQTSCGFGVPKFEFVEQRSKLIDHCRSMGQEGLEVYWNQKNTISIDGLETGIKDGTDY